ncbi:hypothetical protein [Kordiimonas sp. SCSIO 12610]|uniref:hypothetical protein n=1 Tax=Kordiimonas sp. SCSIO 12610 TaxID=2829597 RepID=UPI00210AF7CE|nr:hypothetical protein [Kordiimonas sp. SCSIO 12610]UTW56138.1 hypothetical protein KFF44_04375 [Kordiimonas sp. SCSIO 12610]
MKTIAKYIGSYFLGLLMAYCVLYVIYNLCGARFIADPSSVYDDPKESCKVLCGAYGSYEGTILKRDQDYFLKTEFGEITFEDPIDLSACVGKVVSFGGLIRRSLFSSEIYVEKLVSLNGSEIGEGIEKKCFYLTNNIWWTHERTWSANPVQVRGYWPYKMYEPVYKPGKEGVKHEAPE